MSAESLDTGPVEDPNGAIFRRRSDDKVNFAGNKPIHVFAE